MLEPVKDTDPRTRDVIGPIQDLYRDALEAIRGRDQIATENMAFYRGLHWGFAPESGGWIEPAADGEEREVENYIRPTVRSAVASMLRNMPDVVAVPANSDQSSAARALAVQRLARSMLANGMIDFETLVRGEVAVAVHGACWFKVYFDPNRGPPIFANTVDPATGAQKRVRQGFQGDVRIEFRDIIDVLADPHATSEDDLRHVFDRKMVPLSALEDHFPFDFDGVSTLGRWTPTHRDPTRIARDAVEQAPRFVQGGWSSAGRARGNQLCELIEYWEKPTNARPGGRLVVYCGTVLLVDADLPYDWPWVLALGQNIVPSSIYPDGVVADIKSIQRSINIAATKRLELIRHGTAAHLLVPRQSKINVDHIDDIAGGLIYYGQETGTSPVPQWLQPAAIPQALFEAEASGMSIIKDVSTYSDISRGDAPAGVETGRALAYLNEFQQGVRDPDVAVFKFRIVRIIRLAIGIVRDFFPEGRALQLLGKNDSWLMEPLRRADYDFDANIVLEVDTGRPSSRALRAAEATQYFQLGAFEDTPAAEKFRKTVGYDYHDRSTIDPKEKHKMRARAQIQALAADPMLQLQARWMDDPESYLEVLDDFMAGPEYDALPPLAQQSLAAYYSQFEVMHAQQLGAFSQQQQMLTPGKSAPSAKQPGMASPFDGGQNDVEAQGAASGFQQTSEPEAS